MLHLFEMNLQNSFCLINRVFINKREKDIGHLPNTSPLSSSKEQEWNDQMWSDNSHKCEDVETMTDLNKLNVSKLLTN